MSPYREPSSRVAVIPWRVTRWERLYVRFARWVGWLPYDHASVEERERRAYQRALLRWQRDYDAWRAASGADRKPFPPPPAPPPRRVSG